MIAIAMLGGDTTSLVIGSALAVGALSYVLMPLVSSKTAGKFISPNDADAARKHHNHNATLTAFDMQQREGLKAAAAAGISDADIEEAIRRAASSRPTCTECGVRPEPDAVYCSNCGKYLPGTCGVCGTNITEAASSFCQQCGVQLAPSL